ncbi:unnamed protein product [Strongylus vulgaris]|uniref:Uncharacterized protein n=1 Tax=Strongylus vulgaris TaxID=40348 RepID=A0A3P7L8Y3_STRVU|nr:unnamed protein product [Strongylus vulgaris]
MKKSSENIRKEEKKISSVINGAKKGGGSKELNETENVMAQVIEVPKEKKTLRQKLGSAILRNGGAGKNEVLNGKKGSNELPMLKKQEKSKEVTIERKADGLIREQKELDEMNAGKENIKVDKLTQGGAAYRETHAKEGKANAPQAQVKGKETKESKDNGGKKEPADIDNDKNKPKDEGEKKEGKPKETKGKEENNNKKARKWFICAEFQGCRIV